MDTDEERVREEEYAGDAGNLDVEDAFGEHDIEYWVPRGNRLVPATEEDIAHIQEWERERIAQARLARLKEAEYRSSRWPARLRQRLSAIVPRHPGIERDTGLIGANQRPLRP